MADPFKYRITVNRPFLLNGMYFNPAAKIGPKIGFPRYEVPPEVYNGTLDDGTPFSQACATVDPVYPPA